MFSDEMLDLATANGALLGYALEVEMPDTWFRAHTAVGDLVIDGHTFSGVGNLGTVNPINVESDENPVRVECTLNGLNIQLVGEALKARSVGNYARLMLIVFDGETRRLLKAEEAMIGFVSDCNIGLSKSTGSIVITISDEFELYEMPEHKYWTDENHQLYHPGDRLCRYVSQMGDREIYWGSSADGTNFNKVL